MCSIAEDSTYHLALVRMGISWKCTSVEDKRTSVLNSNMTRVKTRVECLGPCD
jgi:hypothetical protein